MPEIESRNRGKAHDQRALKHSRPFYVDRGSDPDWADLRTRRRNKKGTQPKKTRGEEFPCDCSFFALFLSTSLTPLHPPINFFLLFFPLSLFLLLLRSPSLFLPVLFGSSHSLCGFYYFRRLSAAPRKKRHLLSSGLFFSTTVLAQRCGYIFHTLSFSATVSIIHNGARILTECAPSDN
jgi:hypothetical protein